MLISFVFYCILLIVSRSFKWTLCAKCDTFILFDRDGQNVRMAEL